MPSAQTNSLEFWNFHYKIWPSSSEALQNGAEYILVLSKKWYFQTSCSCIVSCVGQWCKLSKHLQKKTRSAQQYTEGSYYWPQRNLIIVTAILWRVLFWCVSPYIYYFTGSHTKVNEGIVIMYLFAIVAMITIFGISAPPYKWCFKLVNYKRFWGKKAN